MNLQYSIKDLYHVFSRWMQLFIISFLLSSLLDDEELISELEKNSIIIWLLI